MTTDKLVIQYNGDGFFWVRHDTNPDDNVVGEVWNIDGCEAAEYFRMTRTEAAGTLKLWQSTRHAAQRNDNDLDDLFDTIELIGGDWEFWPDVVVVK